MVTRKKSFCEDFLVSVGQFFIKITTVKALKNKYIDKWHILLLIFKINLQIQFETCVTFEIM